MRAEPCIVASLAALGFIASSCAGRLPFPLPGVDDPFGTASAVAGASQRRDQCQSLAQAPVATSEEIALGGALAVRMVGATGLAVEPGGAADSPKNRLTRYLNVVGKNLSAQSARPTFEWTFGVLELDDINAFSTPGGYVFVSKGLLKRIDNEAQLAGVLGHEIAHVTLRHAINQYQHVKTDLCTKAMLGEIGGRLAQPITASFDGMIRQSSGGLFNLNDLSNAAALGQLTDSLAEGIIGSGYAQDAELEADRVGLELALTAGYNPYELIDYLNRLPEGGGLFKNHPPARERRKHLEQWLNGDYCAKRASLLAESDCPFRSYPKVALRAEIKAAIERL